MHDKRNEQPVKPSNFMKKGTKNDWQKSEITTINDILFVKTQNATVGKIDYIIHLCKHNICIYPSWI